MNGRNGRFLKVAMCLCLFVASTVHASPAAPTADEAWKRLNTGAPRPERRPGESDLQHFMREIELSDLRFREEGLKFWKAYPEDARRYEWLLLTVHLPPHYPKDIDVWTANETRMQPNTAAVDEAVLNRWNTIYAGLRVQFQAAKSVSKEDRRYLRLGELKQRARVLRENATRGQRVYTQAFMDDIVRFAREYPRADSELQQQSYSVDVQGLVESVMWNAQLLGVDANGREKFAQALRASGNDYMRDYIDYLVSRDEVRNPQPNVSLFRRGTSWYGLPTGTPDQPATPVAYLVFWHADTIMARKFREMGLELWKRDTDRSQRMTWLNSTVYTPVTYATNFFDAIRLMLRKQPYRIEIDEQQKNRWLDTFARLNAELMADPGTSEPERKALKALTLWAPLWETQWAWLGKGDKSAVPALLDRIQKLYTQDDNPFEAHKYARIVFRDFVNYGLSLDELWAFFEPMQSYNDENLRSLAAAVKLKIDLRTTPLELSVPVAGSKPFELSSLRGKVVLIDFWATTCASCIAAMPRIHDTYKKYRDRGFEVISLCFDAEKERTQVRRIEQKLGLTWPLLAGDAIYKDVIQRFGFGGLPQYMLLDREGRLIADTTEVDMGRKLPALLEKALLTTP